MIEVYVATCIAFGRLPKAMLDDIDRTRTYTVARSTANKYPKFAQRQLEACAKRHDIKYVIDESQ